jgi:hypothetical protein
MYLCFVISDYGRLETRSETEKQWTLGSKYRDIERSEKFIHLDWKTLRNKTCRKLTRGWENNFKKNPKMDMMMRNKFVCLGMDMSSMVL